MSIKKIGQNLAGIPKLQSGGKVQETYIKKLPEKFSEFDFLFSDAPNIINNGANHVGIMTNVANQYNTELGDPNIEVTKIQRGTRPVDQGRAYYRPWDNEMVIEESLPFLDQWIAELSHAKQYQVDKTGYELHDFQDKVIEGFRAQHPELAELSRADIVDRIAYDTPGTVEHDAHRVIEPKLGHEYVNRVFKQYWANHVVPELQNTLDIKKERGDIPSFDDVRSKAYKDWSTKAAAITNKISPEVLSDTFKYDLDKGKTEKLFKEIVKIQAPPRSEMEALQSRITEADGKYDEGLVHEVLSTIRTSAPKLQTGGKINTNMRKKFQLGGLNAFNNIDFSSFDSVLEAGRPMVGSILGDAAQADNPEMFTNQMVKRLGNQAAANSAEEYWTQERDKALALTTNNRVRKQIEEDFNKNKEEVMQNYTTTQGATNFTDAQSGFMDATGFLDLLSGLQFNTGGNLRSKLGYSDNSPFKSLGSIDIDGNVIDMSRTGKTLLATPDVGEPRELKPYSGTHVFPGATR